MALEKCEHLGTLVKALKMQSRALLTAAITCFAFEDKCCTEVPRRMAVAVRKNGKAA